MSYRACVFPPPIWFSYNASSKGGPARYAMQGQVPAPKRGCKPRSSCEGDNPGNGTNMNKFTISYSGILYSFILIRNNDGLSRWVYVFLSFSSTRSQGIMSRRAN